MSPAVAVERILRHVEASSDHPVRRAVDQRKLDLVPPVMGADRALGSEPLSHAFLPPKPVARAAVIPRCFPDGIDQLCFLNKKPLSWASNRCMQDSETAPAASRARGRPREAQRSDPSGRGEREG